MVPSPRAFSLLFLVFLTACGGSTSSSVSNPTVVPRTASVQHVVIVVLENQNYLDVIGSTSMPFFNSLAQSNALATQFYADAHPSIGNYFLMTTGVNPTGNDDNWTGTFAGDNIARQLTAAGKTWKVYAEAIPSVGYLGGNQGTYLKHHNPFAYFDDVINSPSQTLNIVPFTQFASDVSANSLPSFSLVLPDSIHSGHDCPNGGQTCLLSARLAAIDSWLSTNFTSFDQNSSLMANTLLIVTFDESATDNTNGGGRVPLVIAGSQFKTAYQSTTMYQFPSVLRFSLESLGGTSFPGASATAPSMSEFVK
jgi:acid phosphatase